MTKQVAAQYIAGPDTEWVEVSPVAALEQALEGQLTAEEADVVYRSLPVVWPEWKGTPLQDALDSARSKLKALASAPPAQPGEGKR